MAINLGNYNHNHYCYNHITTTTTATIENVGQQSQQELQKFSKQQQQKYEHYINYNQKKYRIKLQHQQQQQQQEQAQNNVLLQQNGKCIQINGQHFETETNNNSNSNNNNNNHNNYYDDIKNMLPTTTTTTTTLSALYDTKQITSIVEGNQQQKSQQMSQKQQNFLYTINNNNNNSNTSNQKLMPKKFETIKNSSIENVPHAIYIDNTTRTTTIISSSLLTTITITNIIKILLLVTFTIASSLATTIITKYYRNMFTNVNKFNNHTKNNNYQNHFKKFIQLNHHNVWSYILLILLQWNLIIHAAIATSTVTRTNQHLHNVHNNNHHNSNNPNYLNVYPIVLKNLSVLSIPSTVAVTSSSELFLPPLFMQTITATTTTTTTPPKRQERQRQLRRKWQTIVESISTYRNITNRSSQRSSSALALTSLNNSFIESLAATWNLSSSLAMLTTKQNISLQNFMLKRKMPLKRIITTTKRRTTAVAVAAAAAAAVGTETVTSKFSSSSSLSSWLPLTFPSSSYENLSAIMMKPLNITSTIATTTTTTPTLIQIPKQHIQNITFNMRRSLLRRDTANIANNVPDYDDNEFADYNDEDNEYDALIHNKSAKGKYIGAPCNDMKKCETSLIHVTCDKETNTCGCEKNYPVQLGLIKGCDKPKKLGEQCFYDETCQYNDENSLCIQVRHNAMCQCVSGFHSVSYTKPTKRIFCTQDLDELNSDLPTLLGVCLGIGVLAGLICMVLHLFSKTKYPRHRNFGDAHLPPPIMYSSETVQSGRPSSRSSLRSSGGSIGSYGNRRSFSTVGGTGTGTGMGTGIGAGSRRPSLASVHSTSSSIRSYSMMRFEKEQQQKEIRQEMKLRLARLQQHQQQHQQQQHLSQHKPQIIIGDSVMVMQRGVTLNRITMATPSPLTPNSMDELLPAVDESQEYLMKIENNAKATVADGTSGTVASATLATLNRALTSSALNTKINGNENNLIAETNVRSTSNVDAAAVGATASITACGASTATGYIGPCSSSNETL